MGNNASFGFKMRVIHRYLGFFLVGIMTVYALSGIVLIFRDTDFLKQKKEIVKTLEPNIDVEILGKALEIRQFSIEKEEENIYYFKDGTYDKNTGVAKFTKKELPFVLEKMAHLHKAKSSEPLFFLNIFFF